MAHLRFWLSPSPQLFFYHYYQFIIFYFIFFYSSVSLFACIVVEWIGNKFLNPQLFLSGYSFRPHVSGESGIRVRNFCWIRSPEWKFLNTLWIQNRVDAKSGYFFIRRRNKIEPRAQLFEGRLALNPGFFNFLVLKNIFSVHFLCYF